MKNGFFVFLLLFPFISLAQQFDINTTTGTVRFKYADGTQGTFSNVSAIIHFDLNHLSVGTISGSVDVSTINTQNNLRDKHLKEKKFFDVENYPKMTFESTHISEEKGMLIITGNLKIKSTVKEVTFKGSNKEGKLIFETVIYGSDFDVATSKKREKTGIEVLVEIPF